MFSYLLLLLMICYLKPVSVTGQGNKYTSEGGLGCFKYNDHSGNITYDCCNRDNPLKNPCATFICRPDYYCSLEWPQCPLPLGTGCPQEPRRTCQAMCPGKRGCGVGCYEVYRTNGCKACFCDDKFENPCDKQSCPGDSFCSLLQVECFAPPCYPIPQCKKKCINDYVECPKGCLEYRDSDGCPRCYCCNNCVNKLCAEDEECVLEQVYCIRAPCNPLPKCIKKTT